MPAADRPKLSYQTQKNQNSPGLFVSTFVKDRRASLLPFSLLCLPLPALINTELEKREYLPMLTHTDEIPLSPCYQARPQTVRARNNRVTCAQVFSQAAWPLCVCVCVCVCPLQSPGASVLTLCSHPLSSPGSGPGQLPRAVTHTLKLPASPSSAKLQPN
jgi:hypothetical protein